jgi:DNA-directed RNA polymerase alpha subunit
MNAAELDEFLRHSDKAEMLVHFNALLDVARMEGKLEGIAQGFDQGFDAAIAGAASVVAKLATARPRSSVVPIEILELPVRTYNLLKRDGIHTIGDLQETTLEGVSDIPHISTGQIATIKSRLAAFNFDW